MATTAGGGGRCFGLLDHFVQNKLTMPNQDCLGKTFINKLLNCFLDPAFPPASVNVIVTNKVSANLNLKREPDQRRGCQDQDSEDGAQQRDLDASPDQDGRDGTGGLDRLGGDHDPYDRPETARDCGEATPEEDRIDERFGLQSRPCTGPEQLHRRVGRERENHKAAKGERLTDEAHLSPEFSHCRSSSG